MNDGTFGVTGECEPFEDEDWSQRIETHRYDPVRVLQWRNAALDFRSLDRPGRQPGCAAAGTRPGAGAARQRCGRAEVSRRRRRRSTALATSRDAVRRLWDVCQLPDFRKLVDRRTCAAGARTSSCS